MIAMQTQQPAITYPYPFTQPMLPIEDECFASKAMRHARPKAATHKLRSKAATRKGAGAPLDVKTQIGSAPHLPYNDLSNDSFLVKPQTQDPVL